MTEDNDAATSPSDRRRRASQFDVPAWYALDQSDTAPGLSSEYEPHHLTVLTGDPEDVAPLLAALADEAPDDDHIEALSISLVEAFLGVRQEAAYAPFEAALRSSSNLRKAWSCAWSAVPDEWEERFNSLLMPGEDLTRRK